MKKLFLTAGLLLMAGYVKAVGFSNTGFEMTMTTYTDANHAVPIMFSSAPIRFIAVTLATATPNGYLAIYRSTSSVFKPDISTQTVIPLHTNPEVSRNLFDLTNTSYTFIQKVGSGGITIWLNCVGRTDVGVCPGINYSGK